MAMVIVKVKKGLLQFCMHHYKKHEASLAITEIIELELADA